MDELNCPVCSEVYECIVREPVSLPRCGHTFCRSCLTNLQNITAFFKCPTCRAPHAGPSVANLPPVYIVLNILDKTNQDKGTANLCKTHGDPIRLWCRPCQKELCGQCLFEQHMSEGHNVVQTQTAVKEMRQKVEMQASQITVLIDEEKNHLVQELHRVAHQLGNLYNKSQILNNHSKKIKDISKTAQSTNQIKTLAGNSNALENILRDFNSNSKSKNNLPLVTKHPPCPVVVTEKENAQQCLNPYAAQSTTDDQSSVKTMLTEPRVESSENVHDSNDDDSESSQDEDDVQDTRTQQAGSHTSESKMTTSSNVSVWPLTCHTPGGKADWPKLNWYNFLSQVPIVQLIVPPENPQVFLRLGVESKSLGVIQIRLWGYLRRAQHFLALCLGTLGPCYRGSTFSHVAKRGEYGERLIGGFYKTNEGYTGHQVIEGLEWRGEYTGPMKAGIIGGSRGRQPKYNSCFCISTKDYPNGKYYCPFGEVVSGLEVAQEAVKHDPVSEITILDTGLVRPYHYL